MTLLVKESYLNETRGLRFGDSDWYPAFTDDRGQLFRRLQREYGRCVSKVYVDDAQTQKPRTIGWVFSKRMLYEDARRNGNGKYDESDYYIREVWVTLRDIPLCARCGKDEGEHHEFVREGEET